MSSASLKASLEEGADLQPEPVFLEIVGVGDAANHGVQ
jgi:hypothetical protein